jgi:hypothetical protein
MERVELGTHAVLSREAIECGIDMCPEIAKIGLIRIPLAGLIEKSYSFESLGVVQEVFSGGIRSRNAVYMYS